MARTEKYFVGPQLLGEIRETITRVAGMPDRTSGVSLPVRLQELPRRGGGGGNSLRFGKVTATWEKDAYATVVEHEFFTSSIQPLPATPPVLVEMCINKFATVVEANKWVMVARVKGVWHLIAAEC